MGAALAELARRLPRSAALNLRGGAAPNLRARRTYPDAWTSGARSKPASSASLATCGSSPAAGRARHTGTRSGRRAPIASAYSGIHSRIGAGSSSTTL